MAQAPEKIHNPSERKAEQAKPSGGESLQRMEGFKERKEKFVATARKSKD
jgi:hypothetical protein